MANIAPKLTLVALTLGVLASDKIQLIRRVYLRRESRWTGTVRRVPLTPAEVENLVNERCERDEAGAISILAHASFSSAAIFSHFPP